MQPYMEMLFPGTETELTITSRPPMDDDQFFEFCVQNRDVQIERTAQGEIIIRPPSGGEPGKQNGPITAQLIVWANADGRGEALGSSAGFILPNGAVRGTEPPGCENLGLKDYLKNASAAIFPSVPIS